MRRALPSFVAAALAAASLVFGTPAQAQSEARPFMMASPTTKSADTESLFWYIPLLKGWYKEAGIDFQVNRMSIPAAFPALASGQIDAVIYPGSAVLAALRGAPMVAVYYYAESANWSLLVNPKIQSAADFAGARCGSASGPKAGPDIACRKIVDALGGDSDKVLYVNVPGASLDYLEAMRRGAVDMSVALVPPIRYVLEREGFRSMGHSRDLFPLSGNGLAVNTNKLKDPAHRDLVVDVIGVFLRTHDWMRDPANMPEMIEILRDSMENPAELTEADYRRALQESVAQATENGMLKDISNAWMQIHGGLSLGFYDKADFKVDPATVDPVSAGVLDTTLAAEAAKERRE